MTHEPNLEQNHTIESNTYFDAAALFVTSFSLWRNFVIIIIEQETFVIYKATWNTIHHDLS